MSAVLVGDDRSAKRGTASRLRPRSIPRDSQKVNLSPKAGRQSSPRGMRPLQVVRESPRSYPSTSSPSRQSSDARAAASTATVANGTSTGGSMPLTPRAMREPVRAATTGSRPGLRSSVNKLGSSLGVPARGSKPIPARIPGRGGSLSATIGSAPRESTKASGAARCRSSSQDNAPILSGLLDSEQLAQLIAASSSSQSRLVELLEEVNHEITTILTNADLDTSTGSGMSGTTGSALEQSTNGAVGRRSSGRKPNEPRQTSTTQRQTSTTSPSSQHVKHASTTGIVSRLCNRVDSLQSSLKVLESKRRVASSPLNASNLSIAQPRLRGDSDCTADSESSIAGLSRLEDMLGRLESQVRASFPAPEEPPPEVIQADRFDMGELEQKKVRLEEEINLLMKQKQELEKEPLVGDAYRISHSGTPLAAPARTGMAVPAAQSWVRTAPVPASRVPLTSTVPDEQDSIGSPASPTPAVASGSTCRPVSPTPLATSQRGPMVPPVPLASLQRGQVSTAAQVSPLAGSCRAVCTPTVPHTVQARNGTPSVGRETPPCSPRSYAAYPTLRSTMGYPAQTLSARRLQKASINGHPCSDPNGAGLQVVGLA